MVGIFTKKEIIRSYKQYVYDTNDKNINKFVESYIRFYYILNRIKLEDITSKSDYVKKVVEDYLKEK